MDEWICDGWMDGGMKGCGVVSWEKIQLATYTLCLFVTP